MTSEPNIPTELLDRVDALVKKTHLTRDQIVEKALRGYLDAWEREAALLSERVASADRSEFASPDDVERVRGKYRAG